MLPFRKISLSLNDISLNLEGDALPNVFEFWSLKGVATSNIAILRNLITIPALQIFNFI